MARLNQITFSEVAESTERASLSGTWRVALACCAVSAVLGTIDALSRRHSMVPDGISYLDISDVIRRGDWIHALNAYWAPLYPAALAVVLGILKPSPYWEFPAAHLANSLIYLGALASFSFLLATLISYVDFAALRARAYYPLPKSVWVVLGYILFSWCSLQLIQMEHVNPDMLLSIFIYLAAAILLRIKMGSVTWQTYSFLGIVLGVGYLSKSPMFPLGIAFLITSVFAAGKPLWRGVRLGLIASVLFLAIASPFVYQISKATGHLTFGDNALINYTSNVNLLPTYYWQKPDRSLSSRTYPAKQLFAYPAVYEFTMPWQGTYVYWYNPAEWYRGTKGKFSLRDNTRQLVENLRAHYDLFFHMLPVATMAIIVLAVFNKMKGRSILAELYREWILLAVPVFGLGMYTAVFFEFRHIGSLVLLFLIGLFAAVCLPRSKEERLSISAIVLGLAVMMNIQLFMSAVTSASSLHPAEFSRTADKRENLQWQIVEDLRQAGVEPGN